MLAVVSCFLVPAMIVRDSRSAKDSIADAGMLLTPLATRCQADHFDLDPWCEPAIKVLKCYSSLAQQRQESLDYNEFSALRPSRKEALFPVPGIMRLLA